MGEIQEIKLDRCVSEIAGSGGLPTFARLVDQVLHVFSEEATTAQRLAGAVLRDPAITLQVLRTANSLSRNRTGRPIASVSHAIVVLGRETVRTLASSVPQFDASEKRSPTVKQLALLSVLTAAHARAIAGMVEFERVEEAYLCGMLRNLGEMLVACHLPEDYARILEEIDTQRRLPPHACFRVLGFTFDDLGRAVARAWRLPPVFSAHMSRDEKPVDKLGAIVAFSHELTTTIYRRDDGAARHGLTLLQLRHGPRLGLTFERIGKVLDSAIGETSELFITLDVPLATLRLRRQLELALAELGDGDDGGAPTGAMAADHIGRCERMVEAIEAALKTDGIPDVERLLRAVLQCLAMAGPFDRVAFCAVDRPRNVIAAAFGTGGDADTQLPAIRFPLTVRGGPIALTLLRRAELELSLEACGTAADRQLLEQLGVEHVRVWPLLVGGALAGALYADRAAPIRDRQPAREALIRRLWIGASRALERAPTLPAPPREEAAAPAEPRGEAKVRAVLRLLRGESVVAVSADLGVSVGELEAWRREFVQAGIGQLQRPS